MNKANIRWQIQGNKLYVYAKSEKTKIKLVMEDEPNKLINYIYKLIDITMKFEQQGLLKVVRLFENGIDIEMVEPQYTPKVN